MLRVRSKLTFSWRIVSLMVLIWFFWLNQLLHFLARFGRPFTQIHGFFSRFIKKLDPPGSPASISRVELITLALKSMAQKKARTRVTVGGMTIGIAAIVFLVSIGYGLQDLVIKRVARLEEMRQTDVSIAPGSNVRLNDSSLTDIKRLDGVQSVLPMIALVARASYQNSSTDLVAYGVTRDYLEQSALQLVQGEIFASNDIVSSVSSLANEPATAEATATAAAQLRSDSDEPLAQPVQVKLETGQWYRVRVQADPHAQLIGYTRLVEEEIPGQLVLGQEYVDGEEMKNRWIQVTVPIWEKQGDSYTPLNNDAGSQVSQTGFLAQIGFTIEGADDDLLPVETQLSDDTSLATRQVQLSGDGKREVVVNRSTLQVLGLTETEAVGQTFEVSFVATGDLLNDKSERLQSAPITYTIIGVTPDDKSPVLYVPFVDLRSLGLTNFSQIKVSVSDQDVLASTRHSIEAMGYNTSSVADTVSQINGLFATARTMLAMLGMVALAVASLGMFNTLTVSLLERTHEVGLMKAMGMKSSEVQDLFLAESMIMGSMGGLLGLLTGFVAAKLLELIVSGYAVMKGVGFISIVSVPLSFALIIVLLSLIVGLLTGIFPARRSTRISALNALRYE